MAKTETITVRMTNSGDTTQVTVLRKRAELIQVVRYGSAWAYPIYLDGSVTRVLPHGGVSVPVKNKEFRRREIQLEMEL